MANDVLKQIWSNLSSWSNKMTNKTDAAIVEVLDLILRNKAAELALGTIMLGNNAASMYKNTRGDYPVNALVSNTKGTFNTLLSAIISPGQAVSNALPTVTTLVQQAMIEPNLSGIPISTAKIETDKNVEISEQQVIIQSAATKKYWTDNAVPRLKEWTVSGYLTSFTPLDRGLMIKPSLAWQAYMLNFYADSRRPILFKTNRNEFVKVQIMNLHTVEEASYNNAIEISLTLKEFNPYLVDTTTSKQELAIFQGSR